MGKVAEDDADAELETEEVLELLDGTSTPEVADGLGKDTVNRVDSADEPAGAEVGTSGRLVTVEDVPEGPPDELGTLIEEAVDGTFDGPPGVTAEGESSMVLNDTGGSNDDETEAVVGALGFELGGTDEDAPGADPNEMTTGVPGEPELCSALVMEVLEGIPDGRPGLCVSCRAPLDVDGLSYV
ncbi:hypothetical protein PMIN06_011564 [Paraphaeosphaeria minitans]